MILVLAATALYVAWPAEDKVNDRMLFQAGRFAIPAEWKQAQEIVRRERFLCSSIRIRAASPTVAGRP